MKIKTAPNGQENRDRKSTRLTDSTLDKLAGMTDAEFDALELYPDFV